MKIIQNVSDFSCEASAVVIGKFDGIHAGHQKLIMDILAQKAKGMKTVVFTFHPSPNAFFGMHDNTELTTTQEKHDLFENMGIDYLIEYPLNEGTASQSPEDFIKFILADQLHVRVVSAGNDVSFGKYGKGNLELLQKLSDQYHYEVHVIPKEKFENQDISSTLIREKIKNGEIETANMMLKRAYSFTGIIQHGKHQGTGFGMPTVNICPEENKILPPYGVYYANVLINGTEFKAITNIGQNPTVTNEKKIIIESYIYGINTNLYGKTVTVELLSFSRPEVRFDSIDQLVKQLNEDKLNGKKYHHLDEY